MGSEKLSVNSLLMRAASAEKHGDLAAAFDMYRVALVRFKSNKRARVALIKVSREIDRGLADHLSTLRGHISVGNIQAAQVLGEKLWAAAPHTPGLLLALSEVHIAAGEAAQARDLIEEAASMDATRLDLRLALGVARFRSGDVDTAVSDFRALAKDHPRVGPVHLNLALALEAAGDLGGAAEATTRAMAVMEDTTDALLMRAGLLRAMERRDAAARDFETILAKRPRFVPALNNFAALELDRNRLDSALALYDTLLDLRPGDYNALLGRARALAIADRPTPAATQYLAAAKAAPGDAAPLAECGHMFRDYGERGEAEAIYLAALEREATRGEVWEGLAQVHDFRAGDPLIDRAQSALSMARKTNDLCGLNFALGRAFDRLGDFDAAFAHFAEGNRLRRADLGYDPQSDNRLFAALEAVYTAPPTPLDVAPVSPRPVFILGMPRSGTSLVEQILSAHPKVHAAGELSYMARMCRHQVAPELLAGRRPGADVLASIRERYVARLAELRTDRAVVTDKLPMNFLWIGVILSALPEARIVHLRRDPIAVCWSAFQQNFAGVGTGYSCDLSDAAAYHKGHDRLMQHWHGLWPDRVHTVDYEALTLAPEPHIRALLAHLDLDWDPSCLNFTKVKRRVATQSALQVKKGLYTGSSEAWRKYAAHLGPLLSAFPR